MAYKFIMSRLAAILLTTYNCSRRPPRQMYLGEVSWSFT